MPTLIKLQETYQAFAFLAFRPSADAAIVDYLKSNTLADDTGPTVLDLFTLHVDAREQTVLDDDELQRVLEVNSESNPLWGDAAPPLC